MKCKKCIGFDVLIFLIVAGTLVFPQTGKNINDRVRLKEFVKSYQINKKFEEIKHETYTEITNKFNSDEFTISPNVYYDINDNLILLTLKGFQFKENPDLSGFKKLKILALSGCSIKNSEKNDEKSKPLNLPKSLTMLDLSWNKELTQIDLSYLENLEQVNLPFCGIEDITLSKLPLSLKLLNLMGNDKLRKFVLNSPSNLQILNLKSCLITSLQVSIFPQSLQELHLSNNGKLNEAHLSGLKLLEKLYLSDCDITSLKLSGLPQLVELDLNGNRYLSTVDLSNLVGPGRKETLSILNLKNCGIGNIAFSTLPGSLTMLHLEENKTLSTFHLTGFKYLKGLFLTGCNITDLELKDLPQLTELHLDNNKKLSKVDLSELTDPNDPKQKEKLDTFNLTDCGIENIDDLRFPGSLKNLWLSNNNNEKLKAVELKGLKNLKELDLSNCKNIEKIELTGLLKLKKLSLKNHENLTRVILSHLKNLDSLDLSVKDLNMVIIPDTDKDVIQIAKIIFRRKQDKLSSIHFIDENGEYKDCLVDEGRKRKYAKMEIQYGARGEPIYSTITAKELKKEKKAPFINFIRLIILVVLQFPVIPYVITSLIGIIFIFKNSESEYPQKFLRHIGWRKILAILFNISEIPIPFTKRKINWSSFQYWLLLPYINRFLIDAKLKVFEQEIYFDQSPVVKEGEEVSQSITAALDNINGVIILRGKSGLGKTMFIKNMLLKLKEESSKNKKVPVYLPISDCKNGVIKAIENILKYSLIPGEEVIEDMINERRMTVFIDGYNRADPETTEKLREFIVTCNNGEILLAIQPIPLSSFPGTEVYDLKPLNKEQFEDFLLMLKDSYKQEINKSGIYYKERCHEWIKHEDTLPGDDFKDILGNPWNLSTAAQLLARGEKPDKIDVFNLQKQQYNEMAKEYMDQHGRIFPLPNFSKMIYQWVLKENYSYLPEDPIIKTYRPELEAMKSRRMLLYQENRWSFRHDTIKFFFTAQAFITNKHELLVNKENINKEYFKEVILEMAIQLPIDEAEKLKTILKQYEEEIGDEKFYHEYDQRLARRQYDKEAK